MKKTENEKAKESKLYLFNFREDALLSFRERADPANPEGVICPGDVCELIHRFVLSSYEFDKNPIPALRGKFQNFLWTSLGTDDKLSNPISRNAINNLIKDSDYVWMYRSHMSYGQEIFVSAVRMRQMGNPRQICWTDRDREVFWFGRTFGFPLKMWTYQGLLHMEDAQ